MNKSNAERAKKVVGAWREDLSKVVRWERLESDVEAALTTAQSELARQVLNEIEQWEPFYKNERERLLRCGADSEAVVYLGKTTAVGEISKSLCDLFTRLGVIT